MRMMRITRGNQQQQQHPFDRMPAHIAFLGKALAVEMIFFNAVFMRIKLNTGINRPFFVNIKNKTKGIHSKVYKNGRLLFLQQ